MFAGALWAAMTIMSTGIFGLSAAVDRLIVCRNKSPDRHMSLEHLGIKECAILIGYDPEGHCIYSDARDLSEYYDGEHVWDSDEKVREMRLQKVKGYLFNSEGTLDQEFESIFDLETGIYKTGYAQFADGTIRRD